MWSECFIFVSSSWSSSSIFHIVPRVHKKNDTTSTYELKFIRIEKILHSMIVKCECIRSDGFTIVLFLRQILRIDWSIVSQCENRNKMCLFEDTNQLIGKHYIDGLNWKLRFPKNCIRSIVGRYTLDPIRWDCCINKYIDIQRNMFSKREQVRQRRNRL